MTVPIPRDTRTHRPHPVKGTFSLTWVKTNREQKWEVDFNLPKIIAAGHFRIQ